MFLKFLESVVCNINALSPNNFLPQMYKIVATCHFLTEKPAPTFGPTRYDVIDTETVVRVWFFLWHLNKQNVKLSIKKLCL